MTGFSVTVPKNIEEALGLLEKWGRNAAVIAGGTDLVVELRQVKSKFW